MSTERTRVVITGLGAVTPGGRTASETFATVLTAKSAVGPITAWDPTGHPVGFAAEITDFDPGPWLDPRDARRVDRVGLFGIAAAEEALTQAGLRAHDDTRRGINPARVAVVIGSGVGGINTLEHQIELRVSRGPDRVGPLLIPMMMANATAGLVALRHGFYGVALSVSTACASGANSIGEGAAMIRSGRADVVVAGGAEAAITPTAMAAFARMGALSGRGQDPSTASRPFDRARDGFVMGEGAGIVVLEAETHATRRGAEIIGELAGYGATCDAHHLTAPDPDGTGAVACMLQALADARLSPADIAHVNAHGTSTPLNDAAEAGALAKVFGVRGPPVTSTKGVTGHLVGAAGAVEAILGLLAAKDQNVPAVANLIEPDDHCAVDLVHLAARPIPFGAVLSNSFGFGGHNASLVLIPAP